MQQASELQDKQESMLICLSLFHMLDQRLVSIPWQRVQGEGGEEEAGNGFQGSLALEMFSMHSMANKHKRAKVNNNHTCLSQRSGGLGPRRPI